MAPTEPLARICAVVGFCLHHQRCGNVSSITSKLPSGKAHRLCPCTSPRPQRSSHANLRHHVPKHGPPVEGRLVAQHELPRHRLPQRVAVHADGDGGHAAVVADVGKGHKGRVADQVVQQGLAGARGRLRGGRGWVWVHGVWGGCGCGHAGRPEAEPVVRHGGGLEEQQYSTQPPPCPPPSGAARLWPAPPTCGGAASSSTTMVVSTSPMQ